MTDELPRDPLIDEALARYVAPRTWPDDWAAIAARSERRRFGFGLGFRGALAGGLAVVACAALVVLTVALSRDGSGRATAGSTVATAENPYADLAGAHTDTVSLRLIGPGDHLGGTCFAFLLVRGSPGGAICAPRAQIDDTGFVTSSGTLGDGDQIVYGLLPAGVDGVRIPGDPSVEIDGRLFSAVVAPTAPDSIEFISADGATQRPVGSGPTRPAP